MNRYNNLDFTLYFYGYLLYNPIMKTRKKLNQGEGNMAFESIITTDEFTTFKKAVYTIETRNPEFLLDEINSIKQRIKTQTKFSLKKELGKHTFLQICVNELEGIIDELQGQDKEDEINMYLNTLSNEELELEISAKKIKNLKIILEKCNK